MATKKPGSTIATRAGGGPRPSDSPAVVTASTVVEGIPSSELVISAISIGGKLFYEGDDEGVNVLASTLSGVTSREELLAATSASELDKVTDHLDEDLVLLGIDGIRNSDYTEEGGLGVYYVVSATGRGGSRLKLAVGQADPFAKITVCHEVGGFPWRVRFTRSTKPTRRGFYPVNLINRETADGEEVF